jgi:hypothetical protein
MKRILAVLAAVVCSGVIAVAANIPYLSGVQYSDPSQVLATVNAAIQSINTNGPGLYAAQPGPTAGIATTALQILGQTVIPTGTLTSPGQSFRIKCSGIASSSTNSKQVGIYFGTGAIVSTQAFTLASADWNVDVLVTAVTATANTVYTGQTEIGNATNTVTPATLVVGQDTTDNLSGAITVACEAKNGTSVVGEETMEDLIVEQVK